MQYYDITRELFTTTTYPGDPIPEKEAVCQISKGDPCNLTYLKMCVHNGTHMDAPKHFVDEGKTIDEIGLEQTMGECSVIACEGTLKSQDIKELIKEAKKKILLKGKILITEEAAEELAAAQLELLGVEDQSVGTQSTTHKIHKILLGRGMVLLEGLTLDQVEPGDYFLCAQPLKLGGCEGASCRAVLVGGAEK